MRYRVTFFGRLIQRLQSVQNTAERLVTGTRQRDNISPVLRQLHWLPARHRIEFEVAILEYWSSLLDHTASYLSDDFQLLVTENGTPTPPVNERRQLCSPSNVYTAV